MRIIAGRFRGKKIEAPNIASTRPTLDRVRETIFNIIEHNKSFPSLKSASVIDLFAGSGAMGLEAYSRGADHVLFVENNPKAIEILKKNISVFEPNEGLEIAGVDFQKLSQAKFAYDFCFMDPPYEENLIPSSLEKLAKSGYLKNGSIIVAESGAGQTWLETPNFNLMDRRIIGSVAINFVRFSP